MKLYNLPEKARWRNGKRSGLKIHRPFGLVSSNLTLATKLFEGTMSLVIARLIAISILFLTSCASKTTISESLEYLKNIDKAELKQLVSYPLCIVLPTGAYCGDRNLGNIFVLTEKITTGKDVTIEQIIDDIHRNDFGTIRIQKLERAEVLSLIPQKERIGDVFYRMILKNRDNNKTTALLFGIRTGKVYVPYSSINQIINK